VRTASWIDVQLRGRGIADERVLAAMDRVPRENFVPPELRASAYDDTALPLAHGQTVSQPFVVAFICEGLALEGDERVLDVGTGSGYQAAVLAELAGDVHTVERIPALAGRAREALVDSGYENVHVSCADGTKGLPAHAPFAAIAVAAATASVPPPLWDQLAEGGRLAVPLGKRRGQRLCVFERAGGERRLVASVPARFVPLVSSP
jgi:protein-L-isoaspartate(D-aspartate) O-methyltransferase